MGKSSPAPAPDPKATAAAQAAANKETAIAQSELNMINQNTPWGSLAYEQTGKSDKGTPQYTATQTLAPEQQQILDLTNDASIKYGQTANSQLDAISGQLSQPLDYSSLGAAPTLNEGTRDEVADALYARMNPQFALQEQRMIDRLAAQGITDPGSQAYQAEYDNYARSMNDARLAVEANALSQAAQLYGLEGNQRDRAINEMIQQRSQPLNELAAMLSGTQVQGPQFVNTPQTGVQPTNAMDSIYSSYALSQQADQAANQGLFDLLGAGAGIGAATYGGAGWTFSDRRVKTDIERVGTAANGLPVYHYRYVGGGGTYRGYMADEVEAIFPHAVTEIGGYKAVNYAEVPNA